MNHASRNKTLFVKHVSQKSIPQKKGVKVHKIKCDTVEN